MWRQRRDCLAPPHPMQGIFQVPSRTLRAMCAAMWGSAQRQLSDSARRSVPGQQPPAASWGVAPIVSTTDAWAPANASTSSRAMLLMCIMVEEDCRRVGGLGQPCRCDQCQQLKLMQQKHHTPHRWACHEAKRHWCEGNRQLDGAMRGGEAQLQGCSGPRHHQYPSRGRRRLT